jgi:hypothetical protein
MRRSIVRSTQRARNRSMKDTPGDVGLRGAKVIRPIHGVWQTIARRGQTPLAAYQGECYGSKLKRR